MQLRTCALLTAVLAASLVSADSLKDKQDHAAEQKAAEAALKDLNTFCGSHIEYKFDWSTWKVAIKTGMHASAACDMAFGGIHKICEDATGKEAVAKQLKTFVCMGDGTDGDKASYSAGTLTVHTSLDKATGLLVPTKKALEDGLK
jgi:hypothetical protein